MAAGVFHDIGKIVIPDNILLKPARLTEEEMDCMKTHTLRGAEMIVSIVDAYDALTSERVYKKAYSSREAFLQGLITVRCGVSTTKEHIYRHG